MSSACREALPEAIGRPRAINVNAVVPLVMLDVGFPVGALRSISPLARAVSLILPVQEERHRPNSLVKSGAAAAAIVDFGL